MTLDHSIASIMTRLADWGGYPKYSLERRVDIFLTPFLEGFVRGQPGFLDAPVQLVAPELPVLSDLREKGPFAEREDLTARTVNVDYLLRIGGSKPAWLFLELKTDPGSFDGEQADLYALAKTRSMKRMVEDLHYVRKKTEARHRPKYDKLIDTLPPAGECNQAVRVAYLAPHLVRDDADAHWWIRPPAMAALPGVPDKVKTVDHFFSLEDMAEQAIGTIPPEHRALWPYVRDLLRSITKSSRVHP